MAQSTKGHNSWNTFQSLFKSDSVQFLITTNLFIKLWGSSSNSFLDILLTRENAQNLQRDITLAQKQWAPQTSFSSLPIYLSSYEALALTVFEIYCRQGKNVKIYKGPLLLKYFYQNLSKS